MIAQRARARPQGHRRPGAQPLLRRARVVPGRAGRRPGQPRARALHLPRRPRRPTASCRRTTGQSVFGGPAWTRVTEADGTPGQWYLHLFDTKQPDFDWDEPRGARRVRVHPAVLARPRRRRLPGRRRARPDQGGGPARLEPRTARRCSTSGRRTRRRTGPRKRARCGTRTACTRSTAQWRALLDDLRPTPDRILVRRGLGRARWSARSRYVRADEMHQAFNFDFLETPVARRRPARGHRRPRCAAADSVGAPTHLGAVQPRRRAPRLAPRPAGRARRGPTASAPTDPQPDRDLGLRRARAATALMLALPGGAYLYQGEELGLPDSTDMPRRVPPGPDASRAPTAHGDRPRRLPRADAVGQARRPVARLRPDRPDAGCRSPASTRDYAVDQQDGVEGSTLELYRALLRPRRERALGTGSLTWVEGFADDVVALAQPRPADGQRPTARRGQPRGRARRPARRPDRAGRLGSADRRGPRARRTPRSGPRAECIRRLSRHTGV